MYSAFYCFSEKPFEITPDPEFLYLTPTYHVALDTTIKSIRDRSAFVSITGEAGTGKTMLIYSILIRLDEKVKTAFIFHPSIDLPRINQQDPSGFGPDRCRKKQGSSFKTIWANIYSKDSLTDEMLVIFIDEAQNLSKEVMEELGKLQEMDSLDIESPTDYLCRTT